MFSINEKIFVYLTESFFGATATGDLDTVKCLVRENPAIIYTACVQAGRSYEMKGLHFAARNGHLNVIKFLLKKNPEMIHNKAADKTLFQFAVENGHLDIVKLLLKKDSTAIETVDDCGQTALHIATERGHFAVAEFLLQQKQDLISAKTTYFTHFCYGSGSTALHFAAGKGYFNIVKLMIKNAADIYAENNDGLTPLMLVQAEQISQQQKILELHQEIVKFLVKNAADIQEQNDPDLTPLMLVQKAQIWLTKQPRQDERKNYKLKKCIKDFICFNKAIAKGDKVINHLILASLENPPSKVKASAEINDVVIATWKQNILATIHPNKNSVDPYNKLTFSRRKFWTVPPKEKFITKWEDYENEGNNAQQALSPKP